MKQRPHPTKQKETGAVLHVTAPAIISVVCRSIEVVEEHGMFGLFLNGEFGPTRLGVGNDLRSFVEGRIGSGIASPNLRTALLELRKLGESKAWNFDAMKTAALM